MKTFKSASWDFEFTGTRAEAIEACRLFLQKLAQNNILTNQRFTWRAEDESGFTMLVNSVNLVGVVAKWNAARN